jgi:hypothetical protein
MSRSRNPLSLVMTAQFPAELIGGGNGIAFTATTSASTAQQLPVAPGTNLTVYNDGVVAVWFLFGSASSVRATLTSTPVPMGCKEVFRVPIPDEDEDPFTWVSVITRSGEAYVTFNPIGEGT